MIDISIISEVATQGKEFEPGVLSKDGGLKTKFKIPATERKVRYAFDSGGTMFDKKVEKKIAYHKLMAGGIREADRIVAEAKADSV